MMTAADTPEVLTFTAPFRMRECEPKMACIISCEVNAGTNMCPAWEPRTYEAKRLFPKGKPFRVTEESRGGLVFNEVFTDWLKMCDWLGLMRIQNIEYMDVSS